MRLLLLLLPLLALVRATTNNLTDLVAWDPFSLTIEGKRTYIYSAEVHYPRLPVPELWLDVFQKIRASGYNAISVYFFWSFHSPVEDVYDFTSGAHDIQQMFDYAKQAGLFVIARPGPYINGETNAGGFALYLANGSGGGLRTSDATYYAAWKPWIAAVGPIIADNSITNGGPVILVQVENELTETTHSPTNTLVIYMEEIEAAYLAAGIQVPTTSNEKGMRGESWSVDYENVGGAVNVYGLDSYPGGFVCDDIDSGYDVVTTYYQWFQNYSFTQPEFLPEFQAGYLQGWGAYNYVDCPSALSPNFSDLFYKNNIGQRINMQSHYMTYGGTNWGQSAAPVVYTSYDYDAHIAETRQIRSKLGASKLVGLFGRSSSTLLQTNMEGNGTTYTSDDSIFTWYLKNPTTDTGFYTVLHADSSTMDSTTFSLDVESSAGALTLTDINLNGRQSKIIVTDYPLGFETLLFSTADIATYSTFGTVDVVVLYAQAGQTSFFALKNGSYTSFDTYGDSNVTTSQTNGNITTFTYSQEAGISVVALTDGPIFYLVDTFTAWTFWAPPTITGPLAGTVSDTEPVFVFGPYLVRNATVSGSTVDLLGDSGEITTIEVYAGSEVDTVTWNGAALPTTATDYGSLVGTIPGAGNTTSLDLPLLENWMSANTLPEISPSFDDSNWTVCNQMTTLNPITPLTLPVLYADDYGFHTGVRIYRGRFDNTGSLDAIDLTASGGFAFGYNAWLNGVLVGSVIGSPSNTTLPMTIDLTDTTLLDTDNILTVVIDYHGHDETSTADGVENPRGLLGASITGGNFTSWRLQGNAGGGAGAYALDPIRAPMNEGGLIAERLGWFLPGFDPSTDLPAGLDVSFAVSSPEVRLNSSGATFYLTTLDLDIPAGYDVPLGFEFAAPAGTVASCQLFVNGYQYGKYVPNIGPQTQFPVPEGILNNRGTNTIGLTVWAQTDAGAQIGVNLIQFGAYSSGFAGFAGDMGAGIQPGWTAARLNYV